MIFVMYSVKDELTNKLMNPMFVEENENCDEVAKRNFKTNLNNIQLWKSNPADYALYKVGKFDDDKGSIEIEKELICSGRSVLDA